MALISKSQLVRRDLVYLLWLLKICFSKNHISRVEYKLCPLIELIFYSPTLSMSSWFYGCSLYIDSLLCITFFYLLVSYTHIQWVYCIICSSMI